MKLTHYIIFLILYIYSLCAMAEDFQVYPERIDLSKDNPSASLAITNKKQESLIVHVQVRKWQQQNGHDYYFLSQDILVEPSVITLPAHSTQNIRVALQGLVDPQTEMAYRVYIQEMKELPAHPNELQIFSRASVPLFVAPYADVFRVLDWYAYVQKGAIFLHVKNSGNKRLFISKISVYEKGSEIPLATKEIFSYLLPEHSRQWVLESAPLNGPVAHIVAETDQGPMEVNLQITPYHY